MDPDFPDDKDGFEFQWFCRVASAGENYTEFDQEGFPVMDDSRAELIPTTSEPPVPFNPPPGCFGNGVRPLKRKAGDLTMNTNKFVSILTYQ